LIFEKNQEIIRIGCASLKENKTWVRRFCALIPTFSHLKWMFEWFIRHTTFDFPTLQMYGAFSKIKY
jgi:transposase